MSLIGLLVSLTKFDEPVAELLLLTTMLWVSTSELCEPLIKLGMLKTELLLSDTKWLVSATELRVSPIELCKLAIEFSIKYHA